MDIHQELKELSKFLSEYSTSLMAVGVQTSRSYETPHESLNLSASSVT